MVLRRWRRASDELPGGYGIPPAQEPPSGGARRRRKPARPAPPELVEVRVGFDRFAAGALVARLEAEGVPVRLLTMDDHGLVPGRPALQQHRLLVRADDEARVRELASRTV